MADPELSALLRRLALPIYAPTVLYSGGTAAIVPVVPLVGLRLGMSVTQVAMLGSVAGVLAVVGPLPTGRVVQAIGERMALVLGAVVSIAAIVACLISVTSNHGTWRPTVFALAILVMTVGDLTWDLGRQTYLADEVPAPLRARAMTLFGGMLRVGRIVGPLLGAGAIALWGAPAAFVVHLVAATLALGLVILFVTPHAQVTAAAPGPNVRAPRRAVLRPVLLVGAAVLVLAAARTNRDLLLPLLAHHFGYGDSLVSVVFAVSSGVELVLVLPAGSLMDRYGRAAVLVPCLAMMGVAFLAAPLAASRAGLFLVAGVLALGNGLGAGINKTLSADVTPAQDRATWMGLWNSVTGAGSFAGPAIIAVATAAGSVVLASVSTGVLTLAGAAWAAFWVPRMVPRPRRHP